MKPLRARNVSIVRKSTNPSEAQRKRNSQKTSGSQTAIPKRPEGKPSGGQDRRNNLRAAASNSARSTSPSSNFQTPRTSEQPPDSSPRYLYFPSGNSQMAKSTPSYSGGRSPRSRSVSPTVSPPRQANDGAEAQEGSVLHEIEQPSYVVGNAILNPFVPVAPSVQLLVQIVPTLLRFPDTALRQPVGGRLKDGSRVAGVLTHGCADDALSADDVPADGMPPSVELVSLSSTQIRRLFGRVPPGETINWQEEAWEGQKRLGETQMPEAEKKLVEPNSIPVGLEGVSLSSTSVLLCIEEVVGEEPISRVAVSEEEALPLRADVRPSVLRLQQLYGTTSNDIAVAHKKGQLFTASEVLPVLLRAEERVAELATARRLIDWDVTIPTAETIPPPGICFLDENGKCVPQLSLASFTLDSQTLRLIREEEILPDPEVSLTFNGPPTARRHLANEQTVGNRVSFQNGVHRIHGLVGIMKGLAEQVGLERVMEYQVETTSQELFLSSPYIDAEVGDLVLQMNSTIQGTIRLFITGFDCGSVNEGTLSVQKSVNKLECVVKVQYANEMASHPSPPPPEVTSQLSPDTVPAQGGALHEDEHGKLSFVFAATNPHELRYEECRQATRELIAIKAQLCKEENASEAIVKPEDRLKLSEEVLNDEKNGSRWEMLNGENRDDSRPDFGVLQKESLEVKPGIRPLVDQKVFLPCNIGLCEPMITSIAFHLNSFHHLIFYFCLPSWQHHLSSLLVREEPLPLSDHKDGSEMKRATRELFFGPSKAEKREAFIGQTRAELGPNVCGLFTASVVPTDVQNPPSTKHLVKTEFHVLLLRDLILTLALESGPKKRNRFHEIVCLCHYAFHSAFALSENVLERRLDYLEQIAVWAITPESQRGSDCWSCKLFPAGHLTLEEEQRKRLMLLENVLEVTMSATFSIGAYAEAVFYATQRVFVVCLLEGAPSRPVCNAQRQLAQLYMFYGDYAAAEEIAQDVVALGANLYDVDAEELIEDQILAAVSQLCANNVHDGMKKLNTLFAHVTQASPHLSAKNAAMIELFVIYAQSTCTLFREVFPDLQVENPVLCINSIIESVGGERLLTESMPVSSAGSTSIGNSTIGIKNRKVSFHKQWYDNLDAFKGSEGEGTPDSSETPPSEEENENVIYAQSFLLMLCSILLIHNGAHTRGVKLLSRISKDLRSIHESFVKLPPTSDVPSPETRPATALGASGRRTSAASTNNSTTKEEETHSPPFTEDALFLEDNEEKQDKDAEEEVPENVEVEPPCEAVEKEVPDPVEGTGASPQDETAAEEESASPKEETENPNETDYDPFGAFARLRALIASEEALWCMWSNPCMLQECREKLRVSVEQVNETWGPTHPFTAMSLIMLAQALQNSPHSNALSMGIRSLMIFRRSTSPRSWYFLVAHRTLSRLYTLVRQWKEALEHTNAALILAQLNFCSDLVMSQVEEDFIGCVLRCPPGTVIRLDQNRMIQRFQERIARLEAVFGCHSEALVLPLINLADAYYVLRDMAAALRCLQRAVRLADPKGSLFVTSAVLKPEAQLASTEEVDHRNRMICSVLQTRDRVLLLAQLLYTTAAVLEAMGTTSDAQDCYSRCLGLLEAAAAEKSLSAIRVYTAVAKLLYSSKEYGDSLGWARKADRLTHSHYPEWLHETQVSKSLLSIVEHRLLCEEGTYITVNPHSHFKDFIELI